MFPITIKSSAGPYEILNQNKSDLISEKTFVIADAYFRESNFLTGPKVVYVHADEAHKNLSTVEDIIYELATHGANKDSHLIALGGGFVQDLVTLSASIYMRGLKWSYLPTTLAAMGDSCIGGKSSINVRDVKNVAGNFYPPEKIYIDEDFIHTLPQIEIVAGLSEIVKICYAHSPNTFSKCLQIISTSTISKKLYLDLIGLSLESKKYFVENDEFDRGIRKLLNFGHTFGHALESATNFQLPHGVAVLIGMISSTHHPDAILSADVDRLKKTCFSLLSSLGTDELESLKYVDYDIFRSSISRDKKNTSDSLVLVLPSEEGLRLSSSKFRDGAIEIAVESTKRGINEVVSEIF